MLLLHPPTLEALTKPSAGPTRQTRRGSRLMTDRAAPSSHDANTPANHSLIHLSSQSEKKSRIENFKEYFRAWLRYVSGLSSDTSVSFFINPLISFSRSSSLLTDRNKNHVSNLLRSTLEFDLTKLVACLVTILFLYNSTDINSLISHHSSQRGTKIHVSVSSRSILEFDWVMVVIYLVTLLFLSLYIHW